MCTVINVDYEAGKITIGTYEFPLNIDRIYRTDIKLDDATLKILYGFESHMMLTVHYKTIYKGDHDSSYALIDSVFNAMYQYEKMDESDNSSGKY